VFSLPSVRRVILILLLSGLGLSGCGSSGQSSSSSSSVGTPASVSATGCHKVAVPAARSPRLPAPHLTLDPKRTYTVTIHTNCGTLAFTLDVKDSPKTSASFYYLVKHDFFNGVTFHRVAAGFVIQGGDPTGSGAGGPGYTIVEPPPKNAQYLSGDVAMAKTQDQPAGASGSQFFIVTGNASQLPPDYALLGKIVSGGDVVEEIGSLPTNPPGDGKPTPAVVMSKVTVAP
jgi:cyclophilin family peptidyl-prolyl cis-trans isomerase